MRLLAPDALRDDQRQMLDSYRPWLPPGAVCVNVMVGTEPWDIRLLVLSGSQVSLYRFSRHLPELRCRTYAAELEGFSVLPACSISVVSPHPAAQFLAVRPYEQATLAIELESGAREAGPGNLPLVQQVMRCVRDMRSRNLVHGHLCPENIAWVHGELRLLDPIFGAASGATGGTLAPEISADQELSHPSDLYGLGVVLRALLGTALPEEQGQVLKRLLLPSPKQRPSLEEVEEAFGGPSSAKGASSSGKLVKRPSASVSDSRAGRAPLPPAPVFVQRRSPLFTLFLLAVLVAAAGYFVRLRYPKAYFALARNIPVLASQRSEDFERDWESGDRARMLTVARAAVLDNNPAAENAIIDSILAGANPPETSPRLMRVAFNAVWRDSLARGDQEAVIALTVAPMLRQGLDEIPPLSSLHPAVVLAVAAEMSPANPGDPLKKIPLSTFARLPDVVGGAFRQLGELGVSSVGSPEAIGLASIVTGAFEPAAFDAFIGSDSNPKIVIAKVAIIRPIISKNDAAATQLLVTLRDRGGEFGQVLSWFDIEDLAKWSRLPSQDKLSIVLNQLPRDLSQAQYADLLTFPLPGVREQAAAALKQRFFKDADTNLLLTLSGEGNRLTREQTIAIVSALTLEPSKQVPFIAAWFGLKPAPDTVLLLLLARGGYDSTDTFNLEAARYLRRSQWSATTDMLKLLAQHPEPLARTLAYVRLDPKDDEQRKILQARISAEKDKGLLKMVMAKLSSDLPSGAPAATPAADQQPPPAAPPKGK